MAKKEFTYRGKTMEELKAMTPEQFAVLLPSNKRRSVLRGVDATLMKTIEKAGREGGQAKGPKTIRTHKRDTIVLPNMVGLKMAIYNGKEFKIIEVQPKMLGHYLGEFALTRKKLVHGKAGIGATKSSSAITARG